MTSGIRSLRYLIKNRDGDPDAIDAEISALIEESKHNPESGWDAYKVVRAERIWFSVFTGKFEYENRQREWGE